MTSTNMFQGLEAGSKPSSRVLRPPGGASSNLFGGYEDDAAARRPNKMASSVFAPPEEPKSAPKRAIPPGGKSSNIFGTPEPPAQPQKPIPPGGPTNIGLFGSADSTPVQSPSRAHPNKPKLALPVYKNSPITFDFLFYPKAPEPIVSQPEVKAEKPRSPEPAKEVPSPALSTPETTADDTSKNHEPHLGPKPRAHNRVLNPPGGKSSVVFY
uniref:Jupiter microtubule associated homolog 2 n=1 Tax=Neogobius melanostomus TaxID=47308 RepID=A0A8C6TE24_9GOBI